VELTMPDYQGIKGSAPWFEISADAISELSAMENDPHNKSKIRRYAFLVGNDAHDKAQQFADQVDEYGKSVIIFNSPHVASVW
jgi:hypothetical protein